MPDRLLETVRALRVAGPDLGVKPLLAKLREQQPDLGAGTREVREALLALNMFRSHPSSPLRILRNRQPSRLRTRPARAGKPTTRSLQRRAW